jgi:uncharacterized protein YecT (DUF1311 family)
MIIWNKVTWYSKLLAVIFFIGVLPAWTFCIGRQYQETKDIYKSIKPMESLATSPHQEESYCSDTSPGGFVQCQRGELNKADSEMNVVYNKTISFFDRAIGVENIKYYAPVVESLIKSQKSWLDYVDKSCEVESGMIIDSEGKSYIGGNDSKVIYPACKESYTKERIKVLEGIYQYWTQEN